MNTIVVCNQSFTRTNFPIIRAQLSVSVSDIVNGWFMTKCLQE